MKHFLSSFLVLLVCVNPVIAQETDFRFSSWPLDNFEKREVIKSVNLNKKEPHTGVDIAAKDGEEVKAVADGRVYWTYSGGRHGISVGIEHENGWRTTYLHLSEKVVKRGQTVKASDVIGKVGTSGSGRDSEASHLHFALIIDSKASVKDMDKRYGNPLAYAPVPTVERQKEALEVKSQVEGASENVDNAEIDSTSKVAVKTVEPLASDQSLSVEQGAQKRSVITGAELVATKVQAMSGRVKKSTKIDLSPQKKVQIKTDLKAKQTATKPMVRVAQKIPAVLKAKSVSDKVRNILTEPKNLKKASSANRHKKSDIQNVSQNGAVFLKQSSAQIFQMLLLIMIAAVILVFMRDRNIVKNISYTC